MKEFKQMGWMMLGVLIGFSIAGFILLKIFQLWPTIADSPTLSLFVAVPILAGGLLGGGYLAQVLLEKYGRRTRKKQQAEKEKAPFRPKKKKKKK